MGVSIYDIGLDVGRIGERSIFYAMESVSIDLHSDRYIRIFRRG